MGLTLLVPAAHLGMSGGFSLQPLWEVRRGYRAWQSGGGGYSGGPRLAPPCCALGLHPNLKRPQARPSAHVLQGTVVCFQNLFTPRRFTTGVFLYALLTILFSLAGLLYIVLPK